MTSLIEGWLVNNIVNLSIPIPKPAVGGIPYSKAFIKSSSICWASSSPSALALACDSNLSFWSIGSFNSLNALHISLPNTNPSKRSTIPSLDLCFLASGEISNG